MTPGVFMFLAALAVISALGVVVQRNPVHCVLALVVTLFLLAVIFIGLGRGDGRLLQVIVYAGAIMVLFLFVIWLLNLAGRLRGVPAIRAQGDPGCSSRRLASWIVRLGMRRRRERSAAPFDYGSIEALAARCPILIAFEVTSVALAGGDRRRDRAGPVAHLIAGRRRGGRGRKRAGRREGAPDHGSDELLVGLSAVLFAIGVAGVLCGATLS